MSFFVVLYAADLADVISAICVNRLQMPCRSMFAMHKYGCKLAIIVPAKLFSFVIYRERMP